MSHETAEMSPGSMSGVPPFSYNILIRQVKRRGVQKQILGEYLRMKCISPVCAPKRIYQIAADGSF